MSTARQQATALLELLRLVRRFPRVLEHLRSGELCITTVFELSKVITDENASDVLPRFFGTSKRDAKDVVAELAPEPAPSRTVVTAIASPSVALAAPSLALVTETDRVGRLADQVRANLEPATQEDRDYPCTSAAHAPTAVEPKNAELSRVHLTVPRRLLEKLAAAKDALSHSHSSASDADVLEVGLDLVIERHRKRRGIGCKPRKPAAKPTLSAAPHVPGVPAVQPDETGEASASPTPPPPPPPERSRHVPADVWRAVWVRDGGRCAWPLEGGGVCGSTRRLELDHIDGFALGAGTTVDECRLACGIHNDLGARALYGDALMNRFTRPKRGPRCSEAVASYGPASWPPPWTWSWTWSWSWSSSWTWSWSAPPPAGTPFILVLIGSGRVPARPYPTSLFPALTIATRSRRTRCRSFPVGVRGISSGRRKVTLRGTL